jgi:formate C-acetyltransferase
MFKEWHDFLPGKWTKTIDIRDFVVTNYEPYEGTADFLCGPSEKTVRLWNKCQELMAEERRNGGVLAIDTSRVAKITSHGPGYIDQANEVILGLHTDEPLKRELTSTLVLNFTKKPARAYAKNLRPNLEKFLLSTAKTHNDGVFSVYPEEIKRLRKYKLLTGLPTVTAGQNHRRLQGCCLIRRRFPYPNKKQKPGSSFGNERKYIRLREEINEQIKP